MRSNLKARIEKVEKAVGRMANYRGAKHIILTGHSFYLSESGPYEEYCAILKKELNERYHNIHYLDCENCNEICVYQGWQFPEPGSAEDERFTEALHRKLIIEKETFN